MPPHLLTLPREIRNNIYQHRHRKVETVCLVDNVAEDEHLYQINGGIMEIQVSVEQAPLVDVMLIHSQIYAEYRESITFKNYSVAFKVEQDAHLVRPLNQVTIRACRTDLHRNIISECYFRNSYLPIKFKQSILRAEGMRHLSIVYRKGYQAFETVTEEEQLLFESLQDTYEGQKEPSPPPGMTLIQTGNGDAFETCECPADQILRRHRFYFFSFASRSGDECFWAPEHILAIWPLLRGGKALKDILSENPGISEQELDSIAMQCLSKMALW
ncbi:hypothetical protein G6514_001608 [Epicoccum nigrum]|nr:hypothetical protein G6514_001608 [Epicoccum nigrum]